MFLPIVPQQHPFYWLTLYLSLSQAVVRENKKMWGINPDLPLRAPKRPQGRPVVPPATRTPRKER